MTAEKTNFIILFQGRTGSSYLIDLLGKHPDVTARSEMLVRYRSSQKSGEKTGTVQDLYRAVKMVRRGSVAQRQLEAVMNLYDQNPENTRVVGFKTKVNDIEDLHGMKKILESRNVKAIVMDRKNLVKLTISHIIALRLNQRTKHKYRKIAWNLYDEKDRLDPQYIDPDEFERSLQRVIFDQKVLRAYAEYLRLEKLDLEYSDLLRNKQAWISSVFAFLHLDYAGSDSTMLKNTNDDLSKAVTNFVEVKERYRGTHFESMFDEVI